MILQKDQDVLQGELDRFAKFTEENKLVINRSKCYVMKFSRSRNLDFPPEFTIQGSEILEVKKSHKILGIIVQDDLKWEAQVQEMVKKATKTIWVLRRMKSLGVSELTLVSYWKTEGRIHLEQNCPVWHSSLTVAQSRSQRVAMVDIAGRWEELHTRQLGDLGLELLEERRTFAHRTATNSRHQDMFTLTNAVQRQGKQVLKYREKKARTHTYYKSALPYLTRLLDD